MFNRENSRQSLYKKIEIYYALTTPFETSIKSVVFTDKPDLLTAIKAFLFRINYGMRFFPSFFY